jgi:hypothetical protein
MLFDLKIFSVLLFIWAVLNLLNGFLILLVDVFLIQVPNYNMINASIRIFIGLDTLVMFAYVWINGDKIVILFKKTVLGDETDGKLHKSTDSRSREEN